MTIIYENYSQMNNLNTMQQSMPNVRYIQPIHNTMPFINYQHMPPQMPSQMLNFYYM